MTLRLHLSLPTEGDNDADTEAYGELVRDIYHPTQERAYDMLQNQYNILGDDETARRNFRQIGRINLADILHFPAQPRMHQLAENLWAIRMDDSPEACAEMDLLVQQFRDNGMVVPDYMRGEQ